MLDFVRELDEREVERLRERAAETAERLARLPAELDAAREELGAAVRDAATERESLAEAERELTSARERDESRARRRADAAGDALAAAERRVQAAERTLERLESELEHTHAGRGRVDADVLAASARLAALERMHEVDPPRPGLAGALDWSSRARAAVFVVRSSLETERERLVREASEVSSVLLGEPAYSVRTLRERLERDG
jgi:chromosome segregation ATPase